MDNKEVEMDVAAPARDEFQTQLEEQYLKTFEGLEEGDLIDGKVVQAHPEYDDCLLRAKEHGVPLIEVYEAAQAAGVLMLKS